MAQQGDQYGNYRLERLLGKGGFAEVWLGRHLRDQSEVAIKILNVYLPTSDEQDQFFTEVRILRGLTHPHIVKMQDFGIQGDKPYLILEYASGGTLRRRHPRGTPLPLPLIVQYVKQVAAGLQYAHSKPRIVHRDIKPENMLVNSKGDVLISDFGIALPGQTLPISQTQNVMGTRPYIAPEQLRGHPAFASDQYSLAVVVYEWLCGSLPFKGSDREMSYQQEHVGPPSLVKRMPVLIPKVEQVVFKALSWETTDRFRHVQDFADALEDALNNPHRPFDPLAYSSPAGGFTPAPDSSPVPPAAAPNPATSSSVIGGSQPFVIHQATPTTPNMNINTPPNGPLPGIYAQGNPNLAGTPGMAGNPNMGGNPGMAGNPNFAGNPNMGGNPNFAGNPSMAGNPNFAPDPNAGMVPPVMPMHNQPPQGQLVLPGQGTQSPPGGGFPPPDPAIDYQRTIPASSAFNPADPFGAGNASSGSPWQRPLAPAGRQGGWFERNTLKQGKNWSFLYVGGAIDFFFAAMLAVWLHYGDMSWNLWFWGFLIAWTVRYLCAAIKKQWIAFPLAGALSFYWFLGSWAFATALRDALHQFEPVPPYIIALLVACAAVLFHFQYVRTVKKSARR